VLIAGAQEKGAAVFEQTQALIDQSAPPNLQMERRDVAPSILRGVLGGSREFLVVSQRGHANLRPFRMYINARPYGTNLQVSWYVVIQVGFWRRAIDMFASIPIVGLLALPYVLVARAARGGEGGVFGLDLFDQQDLTAYVTNAHHCLMQAVEGVMRELNQDPSLIERRSRGFLGVS